MVDCNSLVCLRRLKSRDFRDIVSSGILWCVASLGETECHKLEETLQHPGLGCRLVGNWREHFTGK